MSALTLNSPLARRAADVLAEYGGEVGRGRKSAVERDLRERSNVGAQEFLRPLDAAAQEEVVRRQPRLCGKQREEPRAAVAGDADEVGDAERFGAVGADSVHHLLDDVALRKRRRPAERRDGFDEDGVDEMAQVEAGGWRERRGRFKRAEYAACRASAFGRPPLRYAGVGGDGRERIHQLRVPEWRMGGA